MEIASNIPKEPRLAETSLGGETRRTFLWKVSALLASGALGEAGCSRRERSAALAEAPLQTGTITVLNEPTNDPAVFMLIEQGQLKFRSLHELQRQGWLQKATDATRKAPPPKDERSHFPKKPGQRGGGSGFVVREGDEEWLLTNAHVLNRIDPALQTKAVINDEVDIGIISTSNCNKKPGYPVASLAETDDAALDGRQVRIYGFGRALCDIRGTAYKVETLENRKEGRPMTQGFILNGDLPRFTMNDFFCVLLKREDVMAMAGDPRIEPAHAFHGMSGSAVLDAETGKVVGVFHSGGERTLENHRYVVLLFTGPDELREVTDKMRQKSPR